MKNNLMKDWAVAATFAEAGEFETARQFIPQVILKRIKKLSWFDRIMAGVTFAEADMSTEALKMLNFHRPSFKTDDFMAELGLKGCNYVFGVVSVDTI